VTVALRLWGARAASLQLPAACRQRSGVFTERLKNGVGKLPRLTGWQLVLPGKSHERYSFRVAHASRVLVSASRRNNLVEKSAKARRLCQHASRVRYPELLLSTREEMLGRDSVEARRIGSSAERRPTVQGAGTMGPVSRPRVHPANRPTSRPRDETVLLFLSTPFSNSIDRKSDAPPSAISAKSKRR
jgi:hypothetical protein